jgi:Ca2+-binding EF-hand superfamily protein
MGSGPLVASQFSSEQGPESEKRAGRLPTGESLSRSCKSKAHFQSGEIKVSKAFVSMAAAAVFSLAVSSPATAAQAKPTTAAPAKPAPAAKPAPTRAAVLKGLETNFKAMDTNGDGTLSSAEISAAEAKAIQQRVGALRTRVEGEFTKLDTNKDGILTKAEFMAAAPTAPATAPNPTNMMGQLDKNKDGKISLDEYRAPVLARFDSADTNKDGTISQAERQAAAKTAQAKR